MLSISEANAYFLSDTARQCKPTTYAEAQGSYVSDSGFCYWWLRSLGLWQKYPNSVYNAADVDPVGSINVRDGVSYDRVSVRPALWIDLDA